MAIMANEWYIKKGITLLLVKGTKPGTCNGCWFDGSEGSTFDDCEFMEASGNIPKCSHDTIFIKKPK